MQQFNIYTLRYLANLTLDNAFFNALQVEINFLENLKQKKHDNVKCQQCQHKLKLVDDSYTIRRYLRVNR